MRVRTIAFGHRQIGDRDGRQNRRRLIDIVIEDDDIDGEMLETYGGLLAFAEAKRAEL